MARLALAVYRMIPGRPRCGPGHHVLLCRIIVPHVPSLTCKGDKPDWKDWQR